MTEAVAEVPGEKVNPSCVDGSGPYVGSVGKR